MGYDKNGNFTGGAVLGNCVELVDKVWLANLEKDFKVTLMPPRPPRPH